MTALLKQNYQNKGLHALTICTEVDTMVKQHSRGAWGQLTDIYRLAYENAIAGQKFLSENSFSGRAKMYYNLLVAGTPLAMKRFFRNVEEGLVTRIIPVVIRDQFGAKTPKWKKWTALQHKVVGDAVKRLYHNLSMDEDGQVADEHEMKLGWLNDALESLIAKYGEKTEEVLQGKTKRVTKTGILFDALPDQFSRDMLKTRLTEQKIKSQYRDVLWRWKTAGLVEMLPDGRYKKKSV